jgi:hypothetical protein
MGGVTTRDSTFYRTILTMANRKQGRWLSGDELVEALKRELDGREVTDEPAKPRTPQYTLRIPRKRANQPKPPKKKPNTDQKRLDI